MNNKNKYNQKNKNNKKNKEKGNPKLYFEIKKKASSALNYILLIGGAILLAVIVLSLVVGLGGSSKEDSRKLTIEAQSVLDFSQPMEIKKVLAKEGTCSDNDFGTFTVFYNPVSGSGQNSVIVEDYTNTPIEIIGNDGSLKANTYFKDVTIDLSENNLKCTDTFRVYIESEKNGQRKITTPTVLYWPDSKDHVASFTNITATPSNSQYSSYYKSDLDSISFSSIYSNPDDYDYTYWTVNDDNYTSCYNLENCDVSGLSLGINSVQFWGNYTDYYEDIYGSEDILLTETDIVVVPQELLALTIPQVIELNYDSSDLIIIDLALTGSLVDLNGTYNYKWSVLNSSNPSNFVEISQDLNLNRLGYQLGSGDVNLKFEVTEVETNISISHTFEEIFNINDLQIQSFINAGNSINGKLNLEYTTLPNFEDVYVLGYNLEDFPRIDFPEPILLTEGVNHLDLGIILDNFNVVLYFDDSSQLLLEDVDNINFAPSQDDCPSGYIPIPGNSIYGTDNYDKNGFCVMQYEAKIDEDGDGLGDLNEDCDFANITGWYNNVCPYNVGNRTVVSSAIGYPIVNINQYDAKDACESLGTNYHLITNEEWMTIARNIELQSENWSSGMVGEGRLKSGNIGQTFTGVSYNGDNPEYTPKTEADETAKLVLSNGSEVWDLSGNVEEWVDKFSIESQLFDCRSLSGDLVTGFKHADFSDSNLQYVSFVLLDSFNFNYNDYRSINNIWNNNQGLGQVYTFSNSSNDILRGWTRGGHWYAGNIQGGAFRLAFDVSPEDNHHSLGFRCVYIP